jgi:hypothetical protein
MLEAGFAYCYACIVVSSSMRFLSTVRKVSTGFLLVFSVQFFIVDVRVKS